jgi:hypothetical protein
MLVPRNVWTREVTKSAIGCVAGLTSARALSVDDGGGGARSEAGRGRHVAFSEDTSKEEVGLSKMIAGLTNPGMKGGGGGGRDSRFVGEEGESCVVFPLVSRYTCSDPEI